MLELLDFWRNVPWLIRVPAEFWFGIIVVRGIIASDVTSWLEDRGFIKKKKQSLVYRGLDRAYFAGKAVLKLLPKYDRHSAIWHHYSDSHGQHSVLECGQGKCGVFSS